MSNAPPPKTGSSNQAQGPSDDDPAFWVSSATGSAWSVLGVSAGGATSAEGTSGVDDVPPEELGAGAEKDEDEGELEPLADDGDRVTEDGAVSVSLEVSMPELDAASSMAGIGANGSTGGGGSEER